VNRIYPARLYLICLLVVICSLWPARKAASATAEDKERAVTALQQATKADPNNSELWLHLGFAYRKTGDVDQAQSAFEKAHSLDPHNPDAMYMLGLIYEKKHQTAEAKKIWTEYLQSETDAAKRSDAEKHIHQLSQ
jgi:cytochrome c-type biogenesis protein CcmH/NrfG